MCALAPPSAQEPAAPPARVADSGVVRRAVHGVERRRVGLLPTGLDEICRCRGPVVALDGQVSEQELHSGCLPCGACRGRCRRIWARCVLAQSGVDACQELFVLRTKLPGDAAEPPELLTRIRLGRLAAVDFSRRCSHGVPPGIDAFDEQTPARTKTCGRSSATVGACGWYWCAGARGPRWISAGAGLEPE